MVPLIKSDLLSITADFLVSPSVVVNLLRQTALYHDNSTCTCILETASANSRLNLLTFACINFTEYICISFPNTIAQVSRWIPVLLIMRLLRSNCVLVRDESAFLQTLLEESFQWRNTGNRNS